ncbi:MAG: S41 family peptidase [Bacteroidota bacterium]
MQRKILLSYLFSSLFSIPSVLGYTGSLPEVTVCDRAAAILYSVQQFHWSPVESADSLSARVYQLWIEGLDPRGEYFHEASMTPLAELSTRLMERLQAGDCSFVQEMERYYANRLEKTIALTHQLAAYPLDYQREDYLTSIAHYHLNADSAFWADRWRRHTKSQVLGQVYWWRDTLDLKWDALYAAFLQQEPGWRNQWLQGKRCQMERMLTQGELRQQVEETLLQALAQAFDPHTVYFSPQEREAFQEMLTPDSRSFGLEIGRDRLNTWAIQYLLPGGPAMESEILAEGDEVLEIQLGAEAPLDLSCMEESEVAYSLVVTDQDSVRIRVRKAEGSVEEVTLPREHVRLEETTMEAYLLQGQTTLGYIRLPSFYTSYENEEVPGCAEDVSREVIRLQNEGMEGLILDLRDNGGGSLQEALSLAGIFINYGPLTLETGKDSEPITLRDWNRGTIFPGPVVVLVNGGSASASEILAATLQDWNKAIVLGSPTYGKATGQVVVPAGVSPTEGAAYSRQLVDGDLGFLKVTTSAFFRLNGQAYQAKGVMPDITVVHPWDRLYPKEREEAYTLNTLQVDKQVFFTPLALPRQSLLANSQQRLAQDSTFLRWASYAESVRDRTQVGTRSPLRWDNYLTQEQNWFTLFTDINEALERENEHFSVQNLKPIQRIISLDDKLAARNRQTRLLVQQDPLVGEAYWVLEDWLGLESK